MDTTLFQTKKGIKPLVLFGGMNALECVWFVVALARIPSDGKNALIAGLSAERLVLIGLIALPGVAALHLALFCLWRVPLNQRLESFVQRNHRFFYSMMGFVTIGLGWVLLFPASRFGTFFAYAERIRPVFLFWFFTGATWLLVYRFFSIGISCRTCIKLWRCPERKPFIIFLALFALAAGWISWSGWGITPDTHFWNESAVPLLAVQVVHVILLFLLLLHFGGRVFHRKWAVFFLIWGCSALIWQLAPLQSHFFAPGPYPPNFEFYPYSDAIHYDAPAQIALFGFPQGIQYKPIASFFFYLLQLITSGHMNLVLRLQSAIFAVLPALLYLLGVELGSTHAGLLAAMLMTCQEWNALRTTTVLTIHSRLEMSEFLAQILLALFVFFFLRWLKRDKKCALLPPPAVCGGLLALLIYTRFNFVSFLIAAPAFALLVQWKQKKRWAVQTLMFLCSFFISISPWVFRSYQITGRIAPEILGSFQSVVVEQRLQPAEPALTPHGVKPQIAPPENVVLKQSKDLRGENPLIQTIGNHTLHNLTALLFLMPVDGQFHTLQEVYEAQPSPWAKQWTGQLFWTRILFVCFNLILIIIALSVLYHRFGWAGLTVPYLLTVYCASLGLARTSGGRYLVPVNWSIVFLYSIGLMTLLPHHENLIPTPQVRQERGIIKALVSVLFFFGLYLSWTLIVDQSPAHSAPMTDIEARNLLTEKLSEKMGADEIPDTMLVLQGVALYPRFYYFQQGEHGSDPLYEVRPYSRLVFKLLHEQGQADLMLPIDAIPDPFPQWADVAVLVCPTSGKGYWDALAVIVNQKGGAPVFYQRSPLSEFNCPAPEPVCPATNECY